jgi:hypothetical protein
VSQENLIKAIELALEHSDGEESLERIIEDLNSGVLQGWCIENFYLVTKVVQYDLCSKMRICYAAGDLSNEAVLATAMSLVEQVARLNNCTGIEVVGRRGWTKRLAKYGYSELYTVTGRSLL